MEVDSCSIRLRQMHRTNVSSIFFFSEENSAVLLLLLFPGFLTKKKKKSICFEDLSVKQISLNQY